MDILRDIMPATLTFGEATKIHGLGILPIVNDAAPSLIPPLVTLDEALSNGTVTIREVSESGSVPLLLVENRGNQGVLVLDGQELVGGKQNRIVNSTMIILAHASVDMRVSCVEHGRWNYRSHEFTSGNSIFRASSRAVHKRGVTENVRSSGLPTSNQGEVWREVGRSLDELGVRSKTADFRDARDHVAHRIEEFVEAIRPVPNQTGAIFFHHSVNGVIGVIGAELLATPELFSKSLEMIVRSFAFDVLSEPTLDGVSTEPIKKWWSDALGMEFSKHKSIGVGEDIRMGGNVSNAHNVIGSGLFYGGEMIHFSCFSMDGRQSERPHRSSRSSANARRRSMLRSSIED